MQAGNFVKQCAAAFAMFLSCAFASPAAHADATLVGIVTDYQPRAAVGAAPTIHIKRGSKLVPVREHEIIYEGDVFVFDEAAGPKAFVKALVDAKTEVTLDRQHTSVSTDGWPMLQIFLPRIIAASRWIYSGASEHAQPTNAISRELEEEADITVMPRLRGQLLLWDRGGLPLWIGWSGGKPPFKVIATEDGAPQAEVVVCKDVREDACVREAEIQIAGSGASPIQLTVKSANGMSWTNTIERRPAPADANSAKDADLGKLGSFLRAAELLDKGQGEYTLESARELAAISKDYPAARAILNRIRDGEMP